MSQMDDAFGKPDELRRRAEALCQAKAAGSPEDPGAMTPDGVRQLVHHLQVHQIELEMQNEELRRTQVELDAARARYFDLYHRAPLGYCTLDREDLFLEANLTLATLLGTARGTLVRQRITRFILDEDQDIYYLFRKRVFQAGAQKTCELRMARPDGTSFWAHLDFSAEADGELESRVVISDVSERKRSEGERQHLELQLQRSQNMETLGRLAGGVAHDMNNVLAAILGLASAHLELQPEDSSAHQAFGVIVQAAVRGGNTVKSLLAFAHQSPAEVREIDLNELLRE